MARSTGANALARMIDAAIIPGTELDDTLRRFLGDAATGLAIAAPVVWLFTHLLGITLHPAPVAMWTTIALTRTVTVDATALAVSFGRFDGGLPRHALHGVAAGGVAHTTTTPIDFSKEVLKARPEFFPEAGTDLELTIQLTVPVHADILQRVVPAGELLEAGAQRGGGGFGPLGGVGGVLVPGPLHGVAAQVVAGGELVVGLGVEVGVGEGLHRMLGGRVHSLQRDGPIREDAADIDQRP